MLLLAGCLLLSLAGCQGCENPAGPSSSTQAVMYLKLTVAMPATPVTLTNVHVWVTTTGGGDEEIYNGALTINSANVVQSGTLAGCYYWQSSNSNSHAEKNASAVFNFSFTGSTQSIYYTVNEVANGSTSIVDAGGASTYAGTCNY
jgi:hypothetical protein